MTTRSTAVGFRVKSGWAAVVVVAGTSDSLQVVESRRIELADPSEPESVQPWHAGLELPKEQAARVVARLAKSVERFGRAQVRRLLDELAAHDRLVGAGVVVGSRVDPVTIANDHIRAHAEEGRLFASVVTDVVVARRLEIAFFVEKRLVDAVAGRLRRSPAALKSELAALGREVRGAWRAEQKCAALAAWSLLR